MSSTDISRRTSDALDRVMDYFGIDQYNRPLFGRAAAIAGVDEFSRTVEALDAVVAADERSGCGARLTERIKREKEAARLQQQKEKGRG